MGAPDLPFTTTNGRLKREDFRRTKHDSVFTKWKILIGPSDWEDYTLGKEGSERYRVGNLPQVSGPGLYEIGVAVWPTASGRDVGKLDPDRIVVVYLGQADNVRSRLQHYGRCGSHLGDPNPCAPTSNCDRAGLFKEIFRRGFPIVYRWAPMKSKSDAERTEAQLLQKFDYAWNKLSNGARRPKDVLQKIEIISSRNNNIPKIVKMLQALSEQKVGIPIKATKPPMQENKTSHDTNEESFNLFSRVLKFGSSQPRLISAKPTIIVDEFTQTDVCGVNLSDGSICNKTPVKGRKRCIEHKGMRLASGRLINSKSTTTNKFGTKKYTKNVVKEGIFPICGVAQLDSSFCTRPVVPGRKRCMEHKGMRVSQNISVSLNPISVTEKDLFNLGLRDYCGVDLGDGKCCRRQPVKGRKRCEEHKGMRVDGFIKKMLPS